MHTSGAVPGSPYLKFKDPHATLLPGRQVGTTVVDAISPERRVVSGAAFPPCHHQHMEKNQKDPGQKKRTVTKMGRPLSNIWIADVHLLELSATLTCVENWLGAVQGGSLG